jgi:hypothetical protein
MCFGGGGGSGGNDFSYYQNIQSDKDNRAAQQARDFQTAADARTAAAQSTFDTNLANARTGAATTGAKYFSDRGIPLDQGLMDSIIGRVNVPNLDPNPSSYFTPDVFATGIGQSEAAQRTKYSNSVDQLFQPGFERTMLPDTSVDPIVNSILGGQRQSADTVLAYNKARGLLNPTGYDAAVNTLGQQESAGRSTLMDLANSVLGKDRSGLTDIRGEAGTLASGYNYGAPAPNFDPYYQRASTLAGKDLSSLEGSVRGALGSTNLFDVPGALAKGGTAQGPIDLTTAVAGAGPGGTAAPRKIVSRGLGTTGVF